MLTTLGIFFLLKGLSRAIPRYAGHIAAPLALATVMIDIGREYLVFRSKKIEKGNQGALSRATDALMMREFRYPYLFIFTQGRKTKDLKMNWLNDNYLTVHYL